MDKPNRSVGGKTVLWKFTEGPTKGSTYEHTFYANGSVKFSEVGGGKRGKATREKEYASFKVAPGVHLVSYLAASGYTLTIAMNVNSGKIQGFASNEKEWYPVKGTCKVL
jgi:hypothetical protein